MSFDLILKILLAVAFFVPLIPKAMIPHLLRDLVSILIEYGADIWRADDTGKTVQQYAQENKNGVGSLIQDSYIGAKILYVSSMESSMEHEHPF